MRNKQESHSTAKLPAMVVCSEQLNDPGDAPVAQSSGTADFVFLGETVPHAVPPRMIRLLWPCGDQSNRPATPALRFDMRCTANGIEHRLTRPKHPLTNGLVGRIMRTIKKATVRRFHYDSPEPLRTYFSDVLAACNFLQRPKMFSRPLKKSAARNGFPSARPAAFVFGSFGADGMRG